MHYFGVHHQTKIILYFKQPYKLQDYETSLWYGTLSWFLRGKKLILKTIKIKVKFIAF